MGNYKITETWKMWVTVEADSLEEAKEIGESLIREQKIDDVDYEGSDDDGKSKNTINL